MNLVQLIYGTSVIRIDDKAKSLAKEYLEEPDDFSLVTLNYKETAVESLIEEAQTLPLLSDRKALIVNDAFSFTGAKVKSDITHNTDLLIDYLTHKNDDTLIIFKVFSETLDKRKKLTKLIQKNGVVTEMPEMGEDELKSYISRRIEEEGMRIEADALDTFIHTTGISYSAVINELEKLILYADGHITAAEVTDIVSVSLEQNIFKLTDHILNDKKTEAVHLVRQLILQKEEPMKLLHLIISQFRLLYQVKLLSREGYDRDFIAKHLKVHPYRVKLALGDVRKYPQDVLEDKMLKCRNMDFKFKSSYLNRDTLFELFLMEI